MKLAELPLGVIGPVVESDFGDTIALLISFQSDSRDSRELQTYVKRLGDRLREIRSLSKIKYIGEQEEAFYIDLDNKKLSAYKLYLPQLFLAIGEKIAFMTRDRWRWTGLMSPYSIKVNT
ncbi:hypothetical protein V8V91_19330 [Algoriphagus halophilus]|uniref:hypothetical protein n=1 Tax=Algoriphagus halophilus TaxID=226505 RepID=UPI00358E7673